MKKFLSLVLALVLTMSLVVVPANAAVTEVKLDESSITLYVYETKTLKATVTAENEEDDKTVTWSSSDETVATVSNGTVTAKKAGTATITATAGEKSATCSVTVNDKYEITVSPTSETLYFNADSEAYKSFTITPALTKSGGGEPNSATISYKSNNDKVTVTSGSNNKGIVTLADNAEPDSTATITVIAEVDGKEVARATVLVKIADRYTLEVLPASDKTVKVTIGEKETLTAPVLDDALSSQRIKAEEFDSLRYSCINTDIAYVDRDTGEVTGYKEGETSAKATAVYDGEEYEMVYTIKVEPIQLKVVLDEVVNGGDYTWEDRDLESAVRAALDDAVSNYDDDEEVTSLKVSSATSSGGTLYDDDDKTLSSTKNLMDGDTDLNFEAKAGFLGDAEFDIIAKIDGKEFGGTLTIPVVAYRDDIDLPVSGEEDGKNVKFDFPDDYEYWYVYVGSGSFKDSMYSNYLSPSSGWSKSYKAGASYSLKLSDFDDGNVTLYVVGIDKDDVASTGKLEVALDSYDIEYSGTAGTTVTFEQDDFEDMLEEAAEDAGLIGKKNSTAYVEFDYVTFSPLPSSTKEGVLYNGSSKISKTTKCTDLDKVTFEIASKADSQVYIKFTVTAKYYKDDRSSTKATEKDFSGRVLVKVVHEDIKYTVPVDGSVVFKAADFQDFYDDTH